MEARRSVRAAWLLPTLLVLALCGVTAPAADRIVLCEEFSSVT